MEQQELKLFTLNRYLIWFRWFSHWENSFTKNILNNSEKNKALKEIKNISEKCVVNFKERFGINLDYSEESIKEIERVITPEFRDFLGKNSLYSDINNPFITTISQIIIYIGEVFIKNVGGEWYLRSPCWESYIKLKDGGRLGFFYNVTNKFSEKINDKNYLYTKYSLLKRFALSGNFNQASSDYSSNL